MTRPMFSQKTASLRHSVTRYIGTTPSVKVSEVTLYLEHSAMQTPEAARSAVLAAILAGDVVVSRPSDVFGEARLTRADIASIKAR